MRGFAYEAIVPVEDTITLPSQADIQALFQMTPYYWKSLPGRAPPAWPLWRPLSTRISFPHPHLPAGVTPGIAQVKHQPPGPDGPGAFCLRYHEIWCGTPAGAYLSVGTTHALGLGRHGKVRPLRRWTDGHRAKNGSTPATLGSP